MAFRRELMIAANMRSNACTWHQLRGRRPKTRWLDLAWEVGAECGRAWGCLSIPEAAYIDARPPTASSTKLSCNARPDHTLGHLRRSSHVRDMSALPPTAVELVRCSETRRCANSGLVGQFASDVGEEITNFAW